MSEDLRDLNLDLDSDQFMRRLLRDLSGTLEGVVGLDAAEGYVSTVGSLMGRWIDRSYREALGTRALDAEQVAQVCVDLKRRINGDFHLISADETKLVFGNSRCPFGAMVEGRPSLCMMTSNVFGRIAADNLGYARVELSETIARGDAGCRVVVWLEPGREGADTREYYRLPDRPPEAGGDRE
ncbi:methanogen output domain 1-containing protein [Citreimonas salinaria]|uniref:methanogen output domain 1-containing protein n=1 Tax=Citreimonas salinaria TaxID=321339 RepID=UPI000B7D8C98|nr:methanogen output domain 1-containing protein [Citreimonas salinaria]